MTSGWDKLREHIKEKRDCAIILSKDGGRRYKEDADMLNNILIKMDELEEK
jgi:hypothetical protein